MRFRRFLQFFTSICKKINLSKRFFSFSFIQSKPVTIFSRIKIYVFFFYFSHSNAISVINFSRRANSHLNFHLILFALLHRRIARGKKSNSTLNPFFEQHSSFEVGNNLCKKKTKLNEFSSKFLVIPVYVQAFLWILFMWKSTCKNVNTFVLIFQIKKHFYFFLVLW